MSTLTALARVAALASGVAQPIATVRHLHLADRPLVLVPLALAGEANAPLAAMVGAEPDRPRLLIVPQPRNRDQRFAFAAELASVLVPYVQTHQHGEEPVVVDRGREVRLRYLDAPQLLVPNPAGVTFVRLFGRSTRFRRVDGEHPVPAAVPLLGRWLTWFAERAEHPGSSALLAMTDALTLHWATGQSAVEDVNLAALLAWIDPPAGSTGAQAARQAEDPARWPPAGPATDPGFDNTVLAGLIDAYVAAGDDAARLARAHAALAAALRGQLEPTWRLMWRAVALLRRLPAGASVAARWGADREVFTDFSAYVDTGAPQPRRDGAVAAARRLHRRERALTAVTVQRAYDDPLLMAEYRLSGEAFVGTVVAADPRRIDATGARRRLRPTLTVLTADQVRLAEGMSLTSPARPLQRARILQLRAAPGAKTEVLLELSGGLGRGMTAPPGSVPEPGERICYTTLVDEYVPPGAFPAPEETPWTHGGPPPPPATPAPADPPVPAELPATAEPAGGAAGPEVRGATAEPAAVAGAPGAGSAGGAPVGDVDDLADEDWS